MNEYRKRIMKWYLAGPICHVKDNSDREWREEAKKYLDYICPFEEEKHLLDNPKDTFNKLRKEKNWYKVKEYMHEILELDKKSVNRSDGLLVYSPNGSWGTIRECTLAHELGKPIVLFLGKDLDENSMSNTMIGICDYIVKDLNEAIQICQDIESGKMILNCYYG